MAEEESEPKQKRKTRRSSKNKPVIDAVCPEGCGKHDEPFVIGSEIPTNEQQQKKPA